LATQFLRFWLRSRERRKSEAKQWREALDLVLRENIELKRVIADQNAELRRELAQLKQRN